MSKMHIKKRSRLGKKLLLTSAILVVIAGGYLTYAKLANVWPMESYQSDTPTISKPKINKPSSNEESTQKNETNATQGDSSTDGTGVVDTDGVGVNKSQSGASSASNVITLFTPKENQRLSDGVTVEGKSSLDAVQYRLKDNVHGVIGQGQLTVKNGVFSGTLRVHTNATEGTFEIYSFDSQGREVNNIKIGVSY